MKSATGRLSAKKKRTTGQMDTFAGGSDAANGGNIEWWKLSTEQLYRVACDALRGLDQKAVAGDDEATRAVMNATAYGIGTLEDFQKAITRAKPLISSCAFWPLLLPANPKKRKQVIADIDELGLGTGCETNVLGKPDEEVPTTKVALKIFGLLTHTARKSGKPGLLILFNGNVTDTQQMQWREWVKENAAKLPAKLTRKNFREWAKLTEPVLKIFWGENFEQHRDFASCGKAAQILSLWRQSWHSIANARTGAGD